MSTIDASTTAAPRTVTTSSVLYLVEAVLGLVGFVVGLFLLPTVVAAAEQQLQGRSSMQGVDVHAIALGTAVVTSVIGGLVAIAFAVLTIVFARKMRNGRNWARIVLLVFAALHVLGLIALVAGTAAVASAIISVLVAVLSAVAAVLSFLPASNVWFREIKAGSQHVA